VSAAGSPYRPRMRSEDEQEGDRIQVVVELQRLEGEGVQGWLTGPGTNGPRRFWGWLELLRLLEEVASPPGQGLGGEARPGGDEAGRGRA
jgi:hypothetical protein